MQDRQLAALFAGIGADAHGLGYIQNAPDVDVCIG